MKKIAYLKYLLVSVFIIIVIAVGNFYQSGTGKVLGTISNRSSSSLELIFFDVGQGDSSLIISPSGKKILIDGGPSRSIINNLDKHLSLNDRRIDYIILTHPHADHVSGLPEVINRYQVGEIIMTGAIHTAPDYLEFLSLIKEKNIPTLIIDKPQELLIDDMVFNFLEPSESFAEKRPANLNDSSIVFKLIYASTSVLYMGDFEDEESLLASSMINILKSDLIKIGHHGSTNANDKDFLEIVRPQYAVVSVGKDNSFGHPHYRTLYYLKQMETEIFRTDRSGDVIFIDNGRIIKPLTKSNK